ncbi:MAG: YhdP family phospholipid transporter, partial [Rhodanobacter sp.]
RRTLSGPLLVVRGITIGAAAGQPGAPVQIPEATLKFDTGGWLLPSRHLLNVYMSGLQLGLTRSSDDHWSVNGIALGGQRESAVPSGGPSLGLWLSDVTLDVNDAVLGTHSRWHSAQLRLSRQHGWLRVGAVLQREDAPGVLRAAGRFREDGSSGKLWLGADKVDLDALLKGIDMAGYAADQGHGKLAAWLDWHQGRVTGGTLRLDLADLVITSPSGGQANVPALHGVAGIRKRDDGYDVRWASDRGGALALSLRQPGTAQFRIGVAARDLELTPLLPWLALKPGMAVGLAHWLGAGHPRGVLSHVAMHWSQADGLRMLDVAFTGLGIDPVGNLPGVTALHGELRGDAEALSLSLPEQATSLQFSHLFRQPLGLAALGGTLAFWPQEGVWHIGIDSLDFRGAGYAGQIRGEVVLPEPGGHPFVDAYAVLKHADVTAAKLFWPMHSMSPATIAWLDHALLGGTIDQADVVLRGDLGDWPFAHNEGRFEARAQISDLILDYDEDWPQAEGINVVANFINNGMLVEASGGQSLGVKLDQAVALIPDFGEGLLDLNVRGHGAGSQLMDFVTKSPIARDEADTMDKLKLGGSATFDFHMALPLHGDGKLNLSGTAQLKNADFSAPEWDLQLGKLTGPLRFDARGLQAGPLQAEYRGEPSTLKLAIAGGTEDPSTVLSAQLNGRYGVDQLIGAYPSLEWLSKVISGRSDFAVGFTLAHAVDGKGMTQRLTVASPLNGMALALPAPLNKPPDTELPLQLSMDLPMDGSDLQLALGSQLRAHFRLANGPGKPLAAVLAFGDQMPQTLPLEGLRVRGHAAQLDVTGWVQHAMASSAGDGPGLESMEVSTDQAEWFGRPLGAMQV